ncbi:MAG: PASTA domain-containing protein [Clostridia bacterium]|nr:PASTA domain-containing protein [Clostridia bacterium]
MKNKKHFLTFYNLYGFQHRFVAVLVAFIVLFIALLGRIFYLQIIDGKRLQVLAADEWLRDLPLSSKRGEILDCSGVSLATTITTYDLYVRARSVTNAEGLASEINRLLGIDYETALKKVKDTKQSEVLIKMQVDSNIALELSKFDGIYLSQNVKRVYPYSNLLTQVLGYCTIDNTGQAGLESYYDKYLKGVDGKALTQTNAQGKEIENSLAYYIPSVAGANLTTTLDVQMQTILERELKTAYDENKALGVSGIILDATTGGIKAMSCLPNFDLNNVPRNDILLLQQQSKNSAVVDVYEPGSTFKLVTLAAALNEGLTSVDELFYCGGRCSVDGETIKCWKTTGHGSETLVEAFKNSCNCVFVNLALRLGVEKYYEYLNLFGLGQKTGVDISSESSGIIMPKEQVRNVDLARIGFGHAIAVTELQMASVYAKITTGYDVTPHLLDSLKTETETLVENTTSKSKLKLKAETISTINNMLANNINSEGNLTFVEGYDVGGKTGTAQKYDSAGKIATGKYISSFIGTYPATNPKYVIIICVNEPSAGAYYGGVVAKPVGKRIFAEIFNVKVIAPTDANQLGNKPTISMPYLVGKSLADACAELKKRGLNVMFDGDGEIVVEQLPPEGSLLYVGEIVYLITN